MTMSKKAIYWKSNPEWYRVNEVGDYEMTDKAPVEAIKSFEAWKKAWGI